jgi:hypothetical protein
MRLGLFPSTDAQPLRVHNVVARTAMVNVARYQRSKIGKKLERSQCHYCCEGTSEWGSLDQERRCGRKHLYCFAPA